MSQCQTVFQSKTPCYVRCLAHNVYDINCMRHISDTWMLGSVCGRSETIFGLLCRICWSMQSIQDQLEACPWDCSAGPLSFGFVSAMSWLCWLTSLAAFGTWLGSKLGTSLIRGCHIIMETFQRRSWKTYFSGSAMQPVFTGLWQQWVLAPGQAIRTCRHWKATTEMMSNMNVLPLPHIKWNTL